MENDDASSVGTASTDTSMFLRELQLQALSTDGTSGAILPSQSVRSDSLKGLASGEVENPETLPQAMRTLREQPAQIVNFSENTEESSVGIYSSEVEIYVSPSGSFQEKAPGSNKVKITPMVNHVWDHKFYHGNLVAVHQDSDFLAYVLKGKSGGNVRVVSRRTTARNLLKCFNGCVMDISFALSDDIYLAAVDDTGTLFVHSFTLDGDNILSQLILHVEREKYNVETMFRVYTRVIWCPYMPDDESDSTGGVDIAKMLVLLHGDEAQVWNVEYVSKEQGSEPLLSKNISAGVMCIEPYEPSMPVVNAAFAPDGSAIAVAYYSGLVKFFLVDLDGEAESGCMHEWNPHDGRPVTSLFFLDDHRHTSPDQQLWKFALTGANYNMEIKIWSCETWACVQTLRFNAPLSQPDLSIQLKSDIDLTSKYLVLSDIYSRILYILYLHQDFSLVTAHVSSLSKFSLTQPCVSCAIYDACLKRLKRSADDSHLDEITTGELEEDDEIKENGNIIDLDGKPIMGIQVKMYAVHTKSLQEYLIRYRPETSASPPHAPSVSSVSQDEVGLRDMLSDVSLDQSEASNDLSNIPHDSSLPALIPPQTFATSSPGAPVVPSRGPGVLAKERTSSPGEATNVSASSTSSFTHVTAMNEDLIDSPLSSVDPSSVMSPSSVFSQTPQKSNANQSENPLPPISSCDDEEDGSTPRNSLGSGRSTKESPHQSLNNTNQSNQEILEDMFNSSWQQKNSNQGPGDSIESTSSVDKQEERYDENDQEVAQTFGSTLISEGFGGMEQEEDEDKEVDLENEEVDEEKIKRSLEENRKEAKWPDPPDVSVEAKRLVTEAIQQSSTEEEEEKNEDYDGDEDDENDEAEIEEIVLQGQGGQGQSGQRESNVFADNTQTIPSTLLMPALAFSNVEDKLSELADKMKQQQDMLLAMQKELASQREVQLQLHRQQIEQQQLQQVTSQQPSIQEDISKLEDILVSRMEHSLAQHMHKETQRLQDSLSRSDQQRTLRDRELHASLVNEMGRSVTDTVSNTLKTEIKQTINPALHRFVEPMKDKIHQEVSQRLTACDSLLKENISKAVKSRATMDVLANSVGDVVYQQMQQAYTHTFKSAMLPSFTTSMEKTVRDIHGIFQQGTKEYQLYLKQNAEFMLKEREKSEDLVKRMELAEQHFGQSMSHMQNLILTSVKEELSGQVGHAMGSFKDDMVFEIHRLVKEEISAAMKDHGESIDDKLTSYLRSAAATPVTGLSDEEVNKDKVTRDLRDGQFNEAFQSALSAGSLELVLYCCEAVTPANLFAMATCPLSQPVLLSLISQLATNLEQYFDLKMRFISDAIMSLDPDVPRTAEHIPQVLSSLVRYLNSSLKPFSNDPKKIKEIRMLIMAANSLIALKM